MCMEDIVYDGPFSNGVISMKSVYKHVKILVINKLYVRYQIYLKLIIHLTRLYMKFIIEWHFIPFIFLGKQ